MIRRIVGLVVGLAVLFGVVLATETLLLDVHPIPPGTTEDPVALGEWVRSIGFGGQAMVVGGWLLGALIGGGAALWIARWQAALWIVVLLDIGASVANLFLFEHPACMQLGAFVAPAAGGAIAHALRPRSR